MNTIRRARIALIISLTLIAPSFVSAQGSSRDLPFSWQDAPLVPLHRSQADWLVDVGWKTENEMFGPFPTQSYQSGDTEEFFPLGTFDGTSDVFVMRYRSEHAYFWFQRSTQVNKGALETTVRFFEDHIWPLNNSIYGDEWNPGIDGDSRIHIVNQAFIAPGILGAFNPDDQCPRSVCPESNQREIVYINLEEATLGSAEYLTTLAHEHQHLIQYHVDGNEQRWFNEGLSQLAEHLNGFSPQTVGVYNMLDYLFQPDHHLNGWTTSNGELGRYYGASYLFLVYLYEQLGLEFVRDVAGSPYDGLAGVAQTLRASGSDRQVNDIFVDWLLANLLDDPYAAEGRYYYQSLDLPGPVRTQPLIFENNAALVTDAVHQYGADYLEISQPGSYQVVFDGSDQTAVVGAMPHSADWMWWSYNNNSSATRLTAEFDLSDLSSATLTFSAWWHVEADYDWFQVLVSTNEGQDWTILNGDSAVTDGLKAPGAYYSGNSTTWIDERISLDDYVGGPVQIRFEYLTDNSATMMGVALDDIGIEELDYADDVETSHSVWKPEGFMRLPSMVDQNWRVAVVRQSGEEPATVEFMTLDAANTGQAVFNVPEDGSVTLVIGAMAPFTAIRAPYKLSARRLG